MDERGELSNSRRTGMPLKLLERADHLAALSDLLAEVLDSRQGCIVLVMGEAGVGKTALLRRFCDQQRASSRILWGGCDALLTPRPLGPLLDIAESTGGELEELVAGAARPHQVVSALMRELAGSAPTVVVLEDLHWGDEATLDALRLLGRRIGAVPALLLASYRDDALDRIHPLRIVIGELGAGETISRLRLEPLSPAAVAQLADRHDLDADELYRVTDGNPFFVTEVLAAGAAALPQSVRDAVLARAARLSVPARGLLDAVAVVPQEAELWLLEALVGESVERLEECLASGMLTSGRAGAGFRHELARLAIEQSLPADRRTTLHRSALAALLEPPSGVQDLERLAHHAEAASDGEAVLRFAPAAGERAASLGAHREAAAQYARALRFAEHSPLAKRAELLDRCAEQRALLGDFTEAIKLRQRAIEFHEQLANPCAEGDSLCAVSFPLWSVGRTEEAEDAASRAVALLEPLGDGRELARAYCALSWLSLNSEDTEGTLAWAERARELAQRLDDAESLVHAQTNLAVIEIRQGTKSGWEKLERNLQLAVEMGLETEAGRALSFLARGGLVSRTHGRSEHYIEAGIEYCEEHDLDSFRPYLLAVRGELPAPPGAVDRGWRVPGHGSGPSWLWPRD